VNYSIWEHCILQQLVYHRRCFRDVEHLKEVLQTCWEQIYEDIINRSIEQFRKHIVARCCNRWRTYWAPLWLMILVHHHTYVFCGRNRELGQQKKIVQFILHHPVYRNIGYWQEVKYLQTMIRRVYLVKQFPPGSIKHACINSTCLQFFIQTVIDEIFLIEITPMSILLYRLYQTCMYFITLIDLCSCILFCVSTIVQLRSDSMLINGYVMLSNSVSMSDLWYIRQCVCVLPSEGESRGVKRKHEDEENADDA